MSCCGKSRAAASEMTRPGSKPPAARVFLGPSARAVSRPVVFEYVGARVMTVIGQWTGYQYRFIGYGARLSVDPRDRASLSAVPGLREVPG